MLKNMSTDSSKRYWRTPSPSSTTNIKSPRYLRSGLFHKNSSKNHKQDLSNEPKSKPMLHQFKNHLVQMKQQAYRTVENPQQFSYEKPSKNQNELESYGAYFAQLPVALSTIVKTSSKNRLHQGSSSAELPQQMKKNYHEASRRKRLEEREKLKQDYKELMQKHENLILQNTKISAELTECRKQLENLKFKYEEKRVKEESLAEELAIAKNMLGLKTKELSVYNLQIYQMKQQLYELNLQRDKKLLSSHIKDVEVEKVCSTCKSSKKTIISLNNALENKMLEIGRKDSTISSLCSDLHKLDNQIKLYDKPKSTIKKMGMNIDEVNEMIIITKARELSNRIRAMGQSH